MNLEQGRAAAERLAVVAVDTGGAAASAVEVVASAILGGFADVARRLQVSRGDGDEPRRPLVTVNVMIVTDNVVNTLASPQAVEPEAAAPGAVDPEAADPEAKPTAAEELTGDAAPEQPAPDHKKHVKKTHHHT